MLSPPAAASHTTPSLPGGAYLLDLTLPELPQGLPHVLRVRRVLRKSLLWLRLSQWLGLKFRVRLGLLHLGVRLGLWLLLGRHGAEVVQDGGLTGEWWPRNEVGCATRIWR